jgi:subtilase family serine protease
MNRQRRRALRPSFDRLDDRCLLAGLMGSQLAHAYGLDAITLSSGGRPVKGDGSGQTIAIIDAYHDPAIAAALQAFDQGNQLPAPSLTQVNLAGAKTDDGWAEEEALDVETAHAIAPGANLVVVEAKSANVQDLLNAVDVARTIPGVSVVSMSWGGAESSGQVKKDAHFTTPAGHTAITFVAASGDDGPQGGAEWPASSYRVLSVAGTTLQVDASGNYAGESVWGGSSGGYSRFEGEPSFQGSLQASARRSTPDVAFDGDPSSGLFIYEIAPSTGAGYWQVVGGTSLGAPAWAGIIAIADQGRALDGAGTLDGASQALPTLYGLPSGDFHKLAGASGAATSTGLGTPNGASLIAGLVSSTITSRATRNVITAASINSGHHPRHRAVHALPAAHLAASASLRPHP